ncbi:MAG TPA: hypothetical protein VIY53_02615 [Acidobacteriaceae bacterium]
MDPEIAASRAGTEQHEARLVTIRAACGLWLERLARDLDKEGSYEQACVVSKEPQYWAKDIGILHIQEITSLQLSRWYGSRHWTKRSPSTRRQRWVMVGSMFRYWHEHKGIADNVAATVRPVKATGNYVQGPYSDGQIEADLRQVEADVRLRAFVLLLLHTGCDCGSLRTGPHPELRRRRARGQRLSCASFKCAGPGEIPEVHKKDQLLSTFAD